MKNDDVSFRKRITKSLKGLKIALVVSVAAITLMLIAMTCYFVLTNHIANRIGNNEQVGSVQSQLQAGRNLTNVSLEAPNTRLAGIESDIIDTDTKVQDNVDRISQLGLNVSSFSDTLNVLGDTQREYENMLNTSATEIDYDIKANDIKIEGNANRISQLDSNVSSISRTMQVLENTQRGYKDRVSDIQIKYNCYRHKGSGYC